MTKEEKSKTSPIWKRKIIIYIFPFLFCWFGGCWCIMKIGRGLYWFGNKLSGNRLDPFNWTQEV